MLQLLLVMIGGAFGSGLRYLTVGAVQKAFESTFPVGTLMVNVIGCFLIGICGATFFNTLLLKQEYRVGITMGVLGGFTTFSAFGWDTFVFAKDGGYYAAFLNIALNNILGLLAVLVGYKMGMLASGICNNA